MIPSIHTSILTTLTGSGSSPGREITILGSDPEYANIGGQILLLAFLKVSKACTLSTILQGDSSCTYTTLLIRNMFYVFQIFISVQKFHNDLRLSISPISLVSHNWLARWQVVVINGIGTTCALGLLRCFLWSFTTRNRLHPHLCHTLDTARWWGPNHGSINRNCKQSINASALSTLIQIT